MAFYRIRLDEGCKAYIIVKTFLSSKLLHTCIFWVEKFIGDHNMFGKGGCTTTG